MLGKYRILRIHRATLFGRVGRIAMGNRVAKSGDHRRWQSMALFAIVVLAAGLRLWHLDRNGFGTAYYSAGVRGMLQSWHNFFYDAFDPAGFVSLNKPPVAFWIQVMSAHLFGFQPLALLLPQAIEGVLAVVIVYRLVGRTFGAAAGLLATLFLALTPVSVAVDRSSNTDSCLVLVLLLAAWALIGAAERGSWRLLLLAAALVAGSLRLYDMRPEKGLR